MIWNRKAAVSVIVLVACAWGAAVHAQENSKGMELKGPENQTGSPAARPADPAVVKLQDEMGRLVDLVNKVQERVDLLDDATKSLVKKEGDRFYPDILGNMALDERRDGALNDKFSSFKDHFMRSVQGHLVIDNFTGDDFYMEVNGVRHFVPKDSRGNRAVVILVPFGKVKTQLFWLDTGTGTYEAYSPRIWGDEDSQSKWKLANKGGKAQLLLPLRIEP